MKKLAGIFFIVIMLSVLVISGCADAVSTSTPTPTASVTPTSTTKTGEPWGGIKYIQIAGPPTGTMGSQIFAVIASHWSEIPGIQASVFPETARKLFDTDEGQYQAVEITTNQYLLFKAGEYLPEGTQALTHLKHFMTFTLSVGAIVVRADSKYKTLEDLKSATIAGSLGSGALPTRTTYAATGLAILQAAGITPENIGTTGGKILNMGFDDLSAAFQDRSVDAMIVGGSVAGPTSILGPLEDTIGLRIIPVPANILDAASKIVPYQVVEIDWTQSFKSLAGPHKTLGTYISLAVLDSLPDDLVYEMAKQLFETDALAQIRQISKSQWTKHVENARIGSELWEVHPGVLKYYQEHNIPINSTFLIAP